MKTLEELELMTVPQLKGIATSLGVEPKGGIKKAELVQLVYDTQQPDETDDDDNEGGDEKALDDVEKDTIAEEDVDAMLQQIADHFEGEIEATGEEDEEGVAIYVVTDMVGDEIKRGNFLDLWNEVLGASPENGDDQDDDGLGEVELNEEPAEPDPEPEVTTGDPAAVKKALKPLTRLGLKFEVNGGCVKLSYGSKVQTTTINQPLYRVVRTAEQLCKVVA